MIGSPRIVRSVPLLSLFVTVAGCSGQDPKGSDDQTAQQGSYLGLETPQDGFQVRSVGTTIAPGDDVEFCEVAELPGDPDTTYFMNSIEIANGKGSHHLIVSVATPGGKADAKLREMNIGDRVPCLAAGGAFGEGVVTVSGIQQRYGKRSFPAGIAQKFVGGQRVVFDYHYYNTTPDPVEARSAFNMHLVKESEVKQLTAVFGFPNWLIDTPPGQKASFKGDCRLQNDATVGLLVRHTHQWGRDFSTWFAGGARDDELVWSTPGYETDTDHYFEEPVTVKAGEGFRFQCDFENTESYPLRFGVNATDEMCILFGNYWDAHGAYEPPEETCDLTWTDPDGMGHPASYEKAFPPPAPEEVSACLAGSGDAASDPCTKCACDSCATILIKCFSDADCGPIVQCSQGGGDCQSVIDEHSPGTGLSQQVAGCFQAKCADACGG